MIRIAMFFLMGLAVLAGPAPTGAQTPVALCPADFDPDDAAWVLDAASPVSGVGVTLDGQGQLQLSISGALRSVRTFAYQPDPVLRIARKFVENCDADLYSYRFGEYEKRTWKVLRSLAGESHFLVDEKGKWLRGSRVQSAWDRVSDPINPALILRLLDEQGLTLTSVRIPF